MLKHSKLDWGSRSGSTCACNPSGEGASTKRLQKSFKLMNGRDGAATLLPLDSKIGGQGRDNHHTMGQYLTREQAKYIYKKTETGQTLNVDTMKLEIEQVKQLN